MLCAAEHFFFGYNKKAGNYETIESDADMTKIQINYLNYTKIQSFCYCKYPVTYYGWFLLMGDSCFT